MTEVMDGLFSHRRVTVRCTPRAHHHDALRDSCGTPVEPVVPVVPVVPAAALTACAARPRRWAFSSST